MNLTEAKAIVAEHLGRYRALSYQKLSGRVDTVECAAVTGSSRSVYQIETQFLWDGKP